MTPFSPEWPLHFHDNTYTLNNGLRTLPGGWGNGTGANVDLASTRKSLGAHLL